MSAAKTCFVIIGYGKKPSYLNGKVRMLDLDQTYSKLIKPVFDELKIDCYRAIDKNISGSIDKLMLHEIMVADISVVDISTLNANVMWELGVRHALKSKHTIVICEKEQMGSIPFDINSFVIHQYTHSETGIPEEEITRFHEQLKKVVDGILKLDDEHTDSPVFTFLGHEIKKLADNNSAKAAEKVETFADIIEAGENAKKKKDFTEALKQFSRAREISEKNIIFRDSLGFIISRIALCTYKSEKPNLLESLISARQILNALEPENTTDTEVLGLNGAINKRLYEVSNNEMYLDAAINSYERGFVLKNDYYNGINASFMYYVKASLEKSRGNEWEDIKLKADYLRNSTLQASLEQEKSETFNKNPDAVWILFTIAEAYRGKGNAEKTKEYEDKAYKLAEKQKDTFAPSSYEEQKQKSIPIMNSFK